MAKDRKVKQKSKQFTTRETILLITLVIAGVLYAYFTYFYEPTMNEIAQLKTENSTLKTEYTTRQSLIEQKSSLENDLGNINQEVNVYKNQYFKTTDQEDFINILDLDLMSDEELDIMSLSFSEAQPSVEFISEEAGSVQLESRTVDFPFQGSYESLMKLIYRIEQYENIIRINNLDIGYVDVTTDSSNKAEREKILYQGNMGIEFFIIPQDDHNLSNKELPEYSTAKNFMGGLFNYEDGALKTPPFLVEVDVVDEIEEIIIPDNQNETTPGNGANENPKDEKNEEEYGTYLVKSGDTIFSISIEIYNSEKYIDEIMELNKISDPRKLRSGRTILLPKKK